MFNSPFEAAAVPTIDPNADVIFVADMFVEDYVGGAELTSEALISSASDIVVQKLHAKSVSMNLLKSGHDKHWIFSNF